jgi:hypothetical protein
LVSIPSRAKRKTVISFRGTGDPEGWTPEIVAVSFAGSSRWTIQADFQNQFELWVPIWLPPGSEEKGRSVAYRRHNLQKPVVQAPTNLDPYERQLMDAIRKNMDFASKALFEGKGPKDALSFFIKMFEKALSFAESNDPKPSYPDMLPETVNGLRSRRLIAVASNAWVFGGMSWWNDIYFNDKSFQDKHSKLIAELYDAVIEGLVAGTNLFDK